MLANLGLVSAASPRILSELLTRLGGMLTDDVEATRLLACTALVLLFGGIFSGSGGTCDAGGGVTSGAPKGVVFVRSPAWFLPLMPADAQGGADEVDFAAYGDKMPGLTSPLPGSLGDQVYRFYTCLLKALDDVSDEVSVRTSICPRNPTPSLHSAFSGQRVSTGLVAPVVAARKAPRL